MAPALPSVVLCVLSSLAVLLNLTGLDLSHLITTSSSWRNIKAAAMNGEWCGSEVIIVSSKRVKSAKGHFIIAVKDSSYCSVEESNILTGGLAGYILTQAFFAKGNIKNTPNQSTSMSLSHFGSCK